MLSLLVIGSLVCLASSLHVGGGHSPILGSGQHVAGLSRHGDHVDAHVKTNVVGPGGNVHTIHEHVPIPSTIQNPVYGGGRLGRFGGRRFGLFNNGLNNYNNYNNGFHNYNNGFHNYNNGFHNYNNGFNNYNNYNNGFNNFRQPYVTTNFNNGIGFNHAGHIHRKKRAALLPVARYPTNHINIAADDTNSAITSTSKDSTLTVTGHPDSLNSIYTKDVNELSEPNNSIASTDPKINKLKVVRTVTIQPAEFTVGQPADSVTPLASPTDLYSAFRTGQSADNAFLSAVDMQISGGNIQMTGGNMRMTGGNMQMRGDNMQMGGGTMQMRGGNTQMRGGEMHVNGGSMQMTGGDMQMRDRNMKMRGRNMQMRGRDMQITGGTRPMRRGSRRMVDRSRNVDGGNRRFNVGRGRFGDVNIINDGTRRFRNRPIFNTRRQYNRNTDSRTSSTQQFNQRRRPGLVNNYDSTMNARSRECGSCMKKNSFVGLPSEHVCRCEPF